MTRAGACTSLGCVDAKDEDVAVDALIGALGDISGSVRNAAVVAMGKIGPSAKKAVPRIIECYERNTASKAEVIGALGRIAPDSPEALDFLIDVVRGGKGGAIRPFDSEKPPLALRQEAIVALGNVGPKASKCIPVLLDILNVAAAEVAHRELIFQVTADTLSIVGVGDKRVVSTLKRFQQGKGFPAKSKGSQAADQAIITADTAVKRLERAEKASAAEPKKEDPK